MAPSKWCMIALLGGLLLIGLPNEVKPDAPSEETKSASVKECKVHIEKALEQYWEHKEPEQSQTQSDQTEKIDSLSSNEKSEIKVSTSSDIDSVSDGEDEESSIHKTEIDSNADDGENYESDDDEDGDEDDEDDEETESSAGSSDNASLKADNERDAGDPSESSEKTKDVEDIEEDEEDSEETKSEEVTKEKADESNIVDEKVSSEDVNDDGDDDDDDEDDDYDENDEDGKDSDEGENIEKQDKDERISQDKEEHRDDEKTKDDETTQPKESTASVEKKETESDQVTGEADSASSGVVSELFENKPSTEQPAASKIPEETIPVTSSERTEESAENIDDNDFPSESVPEDTDDNTIENIYEEDDDDDDLSSTMTYRSRGHVDVILGLDEIGTELEKEEEKLAQSIFKEIKKIELTDIKPMEMLYKYADSTTRVLGDAEIFNKPMLLFLGPWNAGKTTVINYLLGIERTPSALKTGTGITDVDFTVVTYGDKKHVISGTELAVDWRYSGVQKFGQGFLDHFRNVQIPSTLLKRVTLVDTPGILENKKNTERGYYFNDAFQWFIDRADAIYVVLDPTKVDIGAELGSVVDQLKGRDVRFILNKADTIRKSDLMKVVGQLFWNLSPLMSSTEAPIIYAVSLTTKPYHPSAPARFLADQESNLLYDMKETLDQRVENRILYARRHAVRVRNHAKMVDCYLATYYRHKGIFSNKKYVAKQITDNPRDYNIFEGIGSMTNVSRYDLPDPKAYKEFFKLHPLYDFKPLASTCSYFRGCPMDKLDAAIAHDIPELFAKYKKTKSSSNTMKQEGR